MGPLDEWLGFRPLFVCFGAWYGVELRGFWEACREGEGLKV